MRNSLLEMAPFYEDVCRQLSWSVDEKRLAEMKSENETKLKELDEKIKDAEENLGEIEIRDAHLDRAEFYVLIGDKVSFQYRMAFFKTLLKLPQSHSLSLIHI